MTAREQIDARLDKLARELGEQFDAVEIIVSWRDESDGRWDAASGGAGNFYARKGMMQEWLDRDRAGTQAAFKPKEED